MYISHEKNSSFSQCSHGNDFPKSQYFVPSKVNILPPKMNRVSSVSSNIYSGEPSTVSLSQQGKPSRNFSKNKSYYEIPNKTIKDSFNSQSEFTTTLSNHDVYKRYSCNLDLEPNSDFLKNNGKMYFSTDRRNNQDLENRVRQLQEKFRKNQQNLKNYFEQIGHYKMHLSSSSSNLLDSVNTNTLSNSVRDPLRQISNLQSFSNKQNHNKNILSVQSITNSPKELEIQKKIKQIDLIKKEIKKIISKQQNLKTHVKLFQDSMKEMLKSFKDHLEISLQNMIKRQDKNKKKILDQVTETINQKIKELQVLQSQNLKKAFQNVQIEQKTKNKSFQSFEQSKQKFLGDPVLIKVKQQVYGLIKRQNSGISSFQTYIDLIKRNMACDSVKVGSLSNLAQNNSDFTKLCDQKVPIQQSETTYYLDPEGYLLDSQGYYLLQNEQKVRLTQSQLTKLQQSKILM